MDPRHDQRRIAQQNQAGEQRPDHGRPQHGEQRQLEESPLHDVDEQRSLGGGVDQQRIGGADRAQPGDQDDGQAEVDRRADDGKAGAPADMSGRVGGQRRDTHHLGQPVGDGQHREDAGARVGEGVAEPGLK